MENLKKIVVAVLVFLGFLVVVGVIADFADSSDGPIYGRDDAVIEVKQDYVAPATIEDTSDYIGEEAEAAFYDGCGWDESCNCMFKYLDKYFTNEDFMQWANTIEEGNISDPIINAAVGACS